MNEQRNLDQGLPCFYDRGSRAKGVPYFKAPKTVGSSNTTGTVGVSYTTSTEMWRADITISKIPMYLGSFVTKGEAKLARLVADRVKVFLGSC